MTSNFKYYRSALIALVFLLFSKASVAQYDAEKWKLQLAFGVHNLFERKTPGYFDDRISLITINLGVQHMFTSSLGAKLDLGYSRTNSADESLPFKLNYTRINAQFVYDFFDLFTFMPNRINLVGHVGPGISFTKPLDQFSDNTYTFGNLLGGFELHYGISETFSIYGDLGYVFSLSTANRYSVNVEGFSFNDDMIYATIGVSVSLSGCYFCN